MTKNTCHNIRQLTYEQTHATVDKKKQLTYEKKTCQNIRQLTYEKTNAATKDNSHLKKTSHNKKQLTYQKIHMSQI